MPFTRVDLLATAQRSLAAAGAHDRAGWISLFTADGRVEDPVGSRPHRGHAALARFYDTFIGPRDISFRSDGDLVAGTTVIRDVELTIQMSPTLTMWVPTFIRYDLAETGDGLRVSALSAYWELPAMVGQFARGGVAALPAGVGLGRSMLSHLGPAGAWGFLRGFRGIGSGGRELLTRLLDDACAGDEVGVRRVAADIAITLGDRAPITTSELVKRLSGATWDKAIRSGTAVAARLERSGARSVLIGEIRPDGAGFARLSLFGEPA